MSTEEMRCFNMIERLYKAADARISGLEAECERLRADLRWARTIFCALGWEEDECVKSIDAALEGAPAPAEPSTCKPSLQVEPRVDRKDGK